MGDRYGGDSVPERALIGVGCDRSTVVKSEMSVYDMQINHNRGGRGVYFDELNGHSIELLTVSH